MRVWKGLKFFELTFWFFFVFHACSHFSTVGLTFLSLLKSMGLTGLSIEETKLNFFF